MERRGGSYSKGVSWFVISLLIGCSNDAITKYLTTIRSLHLAQVTFFRLLLGSAWLILYIIVVQYPRHKLQTQHIVFHTIRGSGFLLATYLWSYGLTDDSMTVATLISFTTPLFTLLFSILWRKEKVTLRLCLITLAGFLGIFITLYPNIKQGDLLYSGGFSLVTASLCFAGLDILNKDAPIQVSLLQMMFYSSVIASFAAFPWAYYHWQSVEPLSFGLLLLLGLGGNGILYTLLKAFQHTTLVALGPWRYLSLFLSMELEYLIFGELPSGKLWGALFLCPLLWLSTQEECASKKIRGSCG